MSKPRLLSSLNILGFIDDELRIFFPKPLEVIERLLLEEREFLFFS
jgi:hypothetical protein